MTDESQPRYERLAAAFDRDTDSLVEHEATFEQTNVDPFEMFVADVLAVKDITPRTRDGYDRVIGQWREHMNTEGRHPACPGSRHLRSFITHERDERENHPNTTQRKLRKLHEVYCYWQAAPSFPHTSNYDPFEIVLQTVSLDAPDQKPLPRIPPSDLRDFVGCIDRLRDLAIVLVQLNLGLRASEVCNLVVGEIDVQASEIQRYYQTLGDHWMLSGRPNAVFVPHDRYGNKSA